MRAEKIVVVKVPEKQMQQLPHDHSFPRTEEKFVVYFSVLTPAVWFVVLAD